MATRVGKLVGLATFQCGYCPAVIATAARADYFSARGPVQGPDVASIVSHLQQQHDLSVAYGIRWNMGGEVVAMQEAQFRRDR